MAYSPDILFLQEIDKDTFYKSTQSSSQHSSTWNTYIQNTHNRNTCNGNTYNAGNRNSTGSYIKSWEGEGWKKLLENRLGLATTFFCVEGKSHGLVVGYKRDMFRPVEVRHAGAEANSNNPGTGVSTDGDTTTVKIEYKKSNVEGFINRRETQNSGILMKLEFKTNPVIASPIASPSTNTSTSSSNNTLSGPRGIVIGTTHLCWNPNLAFERAVQCGQLVQEALKLSSSSPTISAQTIPSSPYSQPSNFPSPSSQESQTSQPLCPNSQPQSQLLQEEPREIATNWPIILAGDFNSTPSSAVYKILMKQPKSVQELKEMDEKSSGNSQSIVDELAQSLKHLYYRWGFCLVDEGNDGINSRAGINGQGNEGNQENQGNQNIWTPDRMFDTTKAPRFPVNLKVDNNNENKNNDNDNEPINEPDLSEEYVDSAIEKMLPLLNLGVNYSNKMSQIPNPQSTPRTIWSVYNNRSLLQRSSPKYKDSYEPEFTSWTTEYKETIDYIFVIEASDPTSDPTSSSDSKPNITSNPRLNPSPNSKPRQQQVYATRALQMPTVAQMPKQGLPQKGHYPSDHLALMGELVL